MEPEEAMMFPNERIKTWLANNRANAQKSEPGNDATPHEQPDLELDGIELEPEHA